MRNPQSLLLKAIPHISAVVIFLAIAMAFFSPALEGYKLRQGDIDQWVGMSKETNDFRDTNGEEALWSNSMFGGMPTYQISVVDDGNWLTIFERILKFGFTSEIGILFMAMLGFYILCLCMKINPWVGIAGAIGFGLSTFNILYLQAGHGPKVSALSFMAPTLGGLILVFRKKWLLGGGVFLLFLGLHLRANHLQMTYYLLIILLFVAIAEGIRLLREKELAYLGKTVAVLGIAGVLAILPNMTNLLNTYTYGKYTTRGNSELTIQPDGAPSAVSDTEGLEKSYMLTYSMSRDEWLSLLIPNFKGGQSGRLGQTEAGKARPGNIQEFLNQSSSYWGEQSYTGGAFYYGAGMFMLFLLGLILLKNEPIKWALLAITIIAIILSWRNASGLTDFFIDYVPLFAKFRDTKMMLVLVQIAMPLLGCLFLSELVKKDSYLRQNKKFVLGAAGGVVGLVAILMVGSSTLFSFESPQEKEYWASQYANPEVSSTQLDEARGLILEVRQEVFFADAGRTLFIVLFVGGIVALLVVGKLPLELAAGIFALTMLIDLWSVDRRYLTNEKKGREYLSWAKMDMKFLPHDPQTADLDILRNEKIGVENFDQKLADFKVEYIPTEQDKKNKKRYEAAMEFGVLYQNSNFRVLNLDNPFSDARTSYFHKSIGGYHGAKLKKYQELMDFQLEKEIQLLRQNLGKMAPDQAFGISPMLNMLNMKYLSANQGQISVPNANALGNAWFVSEVRQVADANAEIQNLSGLNPLRTAVVGDKFSELIPTNFAKDADGKITLTDYKPNHLTYTTTAQTDQVAVFSEIYYPEGWNAYIDGSQVDYFAANYVLRGLKIPAGEHQVEFKFEPQMFYSSRTIAMIGSVLFILAVFAIFGLQIKTLLQSDSAHAPTVKAEV